MILTVTANPAIDRVYFVDRFQMGEVHRPQTVTVTAGGKGLNVARIAKTLGADACAMGFAGGQSGAFICEEVQKLGITEAFTKIAEETRINFNITDRDGRSGEILAEGPLVTSAECEQFLQAFSSRLPTCSVAVASGSLPRGLDSSFYRRLIEIAKGGGVRLIVDTSGAALADVIEQKPFMVKPNADELSALLGKKIGDREDLRAALLSLADKGVTIPFITLGADGAVALVEGRCYRLRSPRVQVINTVGSGDSCIGGIAFGLDRGMPLLDCLRLGMAAGTANTQFCETGRVSTDLVRRYYDEVTIEEF